MKELGHENKNTLPVASIKVIGVGGAGGNAIDCMIAAQFQGVEFIAINTDAQALALSKADTKIQIGQKSTKGLGAGANPATGRRSAEEDLETIMEHLQDADVVFVAAGMGGGTGSGAVPVILKALRERGILSIAVLTKPFDFEGKKRFISAQEALTEIEQYADTLLIIPNQKLLEVVDHTVSMIDAFGMINEVLSQSVKSISDIITRPGHINVDFADVKEIMKSQGMAVMGIGKASGPNRARQAAERAINSPLLENMNIKGARGVLLNITGNSQLGLHEMSEAASVIYEQVDADANIILGSVIDDSYADELCVTVIATGFDGQEKSDIAPARIESEDLEFQEYQQELQLQKEHDLTQVLEQGETVKTADDLDIPTFMRKKNSSQQKGLAFDKKDKKTLYKST